jgi:L,D-transpeptidase ErfK/SrfK
LKKQYIRLFGAIVSLAWLSVSVAAAVSHRALASSEQHTSSHDVPVGDELSSMPASITRYNASRHQPEAKPSDDYQGYPVGLCQLPGFACHAVKFDQRWANVERDEHSREILMRLNRTNVALKYRKWILMPKNIRTIDYMKLTPMPASVKPTGHRLLMVDLSSFAFGAYDEHGDLVYWGPASGGKKYCQDTKEDCETAVGRYKVYRMRGEDCQSSKYPIDTKGGAPMPYCMYYHKGFAIHGSTLSGFVNRSRGCVRVFYNDAKWLNKNFVKLGTRVIVNR